MNTSSQPTPDPNPAWWERLPSSDRLRAIARELGGTDAATLDGIAAGFYSSNPDTAARMHLLAGELYWLASRMDDEYLRNAEPDELS